MPSLVILCCALISLAAFSTSAQARCPDEHDVRLMTGNPTKIVFQNRIKDQPIYIYSFDTDGRRRLSIVLQPNRQYEAETSEGAPWLAVMKRSAMERCAPISRANGGNTFVVTEDILRDAISDYITPSDSRAPAVGETKPVFSNKQIRESNASTPSEENDLRKIKRECRESCAEGRSACFGEANSWAQERRQIVERHLNVTQDHYHSEMKEISDERKTQFESCRTTYEECLRDVCE